MLIRIVKFRKEQKAAQVVWSTGNIYNTLNGKSFEMEIRKIEEIGAYYDKDICHMTDCWPFKLWKMAHHLLYISEVHDKNRLV